jgi:hypothetical protein
MFRTGLAVAAAALLATSAQAATYTVNALLNSSTGGTGLATISVNNGQALYVFADPNDLWSAGDLPRWSNADGLTAATFATGSDESGEPFGTQIGQNFGLHSQGIYAFPFGTLVGEIGGVYQALGTSFNGTAWGTGTLNLFYWDSNAGDNFGSIDVSVAVPEPDSWAMLIAGFGLVGIAARRRRTVVAA